MTNVERLVEVIEAYFMAPEIAFVGSDHSDIRPLADWLIAQGVGFEDEYVRAFAEWCELEHFKEWQEGEVLTLRDGEAKRMADRYLTRTRQARHGGTA